MLKQLKISNSQQCTYRISCHKLFISSKYLNKQKFRSYIKMQLVPTLPSVQFVIHQKSSCHQNGNYNMQSLTSKLVFSNIIIPDDLLITTIKHSSSAQTC